MHIRYDVGSGPAVVLLHGQPGSASDWVRVVPLLADRGLRVIAVDRPGYAASRTPAGGWSHNVRHLVDALDRVGVGQATLVGWSWGGGVALAAAVEHPQRVAGLVLVSSVGHELAVGPADRALAAPGVRELMAPVMDRLGRRGSALLELTSGSRLDPEAKAYFAEESALWPATGAWRSAAVEQVTMVRDARRLSAALPTIDVRATVVHGWRDQYVTIRAGAALAASLPSARLVPVEGGHLLPFELPDRLATEIVRAVSEQAD